MFPPPPTILPQTRARGGQSPAFPRVVGAVGLWLALTAPGATAPPWDVSGQPFLAPVALATNDDGRELVVLGANGRRVLILDSTTREVMRRFPLPGPGSGLATRDGQAWITLGEPDGHLLQVDLETGEIRRNHRVGHTPLAPVLSVDGGTAFVALRFENAVAAVDLATGSVRKLGVDREPVALTLTDQGRRLWVANHLPAPTAVLDDENPVIAAAVSVVDTARWRVERRIELPNGSQGLRGIAASPDGRWVVVTHILSRYMRPAWELAGGAMNRNVISLLDAREPAWVVTAPLDDPTLGAANPWAVAFSSGGDRLFVTHAGTDELSVVDFPAFLVRIQERTGPWIPFATGNLRLMDGLRQRVRLPVAGPRALVAAGTVLYVAGFFSDDLAAIRMGPGGVVAESHGLEGGTGMSPERRGEHWFNHAGLCFEQWQSCATCHPDGRSDGLYWDLLNDGGGNTKDTKSLLMAALTPPVMWRSVRADAAGAIRAGMHHIQFAEAPEAVANDLEAWLRSMPVVPSPALDARRLESPKTDEPGCAKCHFPGVPRGELTAAAKRGKALFEDRARCVGCHPHPLFTTGRQVDPGLGSGVPYDVPSLVEVWRSAPYQHNSEALTLHETITEHNRLQKRGRTADLNDEELAGLVEYLRSL